MRSRIDRLKFITGENIMKVLNYLKNKGRFLIAFIICCFAIGCSDPILIESIVLGKQYVPSQSSTGIGFISSGKTVMTFESSPERYIIFVNENGNPVSIKCSAKMYFKVEKGSHIKYWKIWHGRYFIE
jgi:hypothetical protein